VDLALGVVVKEGGGHLAAAGVVDADEQDLGDVFADGSFGLGEGAQLQGWSRKGMGRPWGTAGRSRVGGAASAPGTWRRQAVPLGAERAIRPRVAAKRTRAPGRSR
jgi:hypothetical protein